MEKQRINAKSRFIKRLLIFVFLILNVNSSIFSQYLTYSIIKDLRITPVENQDLYANTEIKFEVTVPYTMPSQMQISIPDLPQNVTFQTLRRTESYSEPGSTSKLFHDPDDTLRFSLSYYDHHDVVLSLGVPSSTFYHRNATMNFFSYFISDFIRSL